MRTAVLVTALAGGIALLQASVIPWVGPLRAVGRVSATALILLVRARSRARTVWFIVGVTVWIDALSGTPVGGRTAVMLAALVLLWPLWGRYMRDRSSVPFVIMGIGSAVAEAAATVLSTGWPSARPLLVAVGSAALWGGVMALVLHRMRRVRHGYVE